MLKSSVQFFDIFHQITGHHIIKLHLKSSSVMNTLIHREHFLVVAKGAVIIYERGVGQQIM